MTDQISVVIVTYNSAEQIDACLASVFAQADIRLQVIVVDNASHDATCAVVRARPSVQLIANTANLGFAAAVNQGAAQAAGSYLLLLNPDAELHPGALAHLAAYLDSQPQVGIVAPRLLNANGTLRDNTFAYETFLSFIALTIGVGPLRRLHGRLLRPKQPWQFRSDQPQRIDAAIGAALLIRRDLFVRLGGLDDRFFLYCEDGDFCLRAARAGSATHLVPQAVTSHIGGASTPGGTYRLTGMIGHHLITSRYRYTEKWYGKAAVGLLRLIFALGGLCFLFASLLMPDGPRRQQLREHGRLLLTTPAR